jgi:hypothetical protein
MERTDDTATEPTTLDPNDPGWGHFDWGGETDWLPVRSERPAESATDADDD